MHNLFLYLCRLYCCIVFRLCIVSFFVVLVCLMLCPHVCLWTDFGFCRPRQIGFTVKPPDEIVIGNWRDERFLEGQVFDTVLADYLVGAIDGFAPYFQVKSKNKG